MKKTGARGARAKATELEPYDSRRVDIEKFKLDVPVKKLVGFLGFPDKINLDFLTIDALGVTKTVGKGRTNLTFIRPTIVQADAATPFATFDMRESPSRRPAISMHFEPGAYGINSPTSYFFVFSLECFGQTTFQAGGFAGSGTLTNTGTKTANGKVGITIGFENVQPGEQTHGFLEQTSGGAWSFFTARARFPFPILVPA
jgi:hypothetical protein